jgi:hypothetical protein
MILGQVAPPCRWKQYQPIPVLKSRNKANHLIVRQNASPFRGGVRRPVTLNLVRRLPFPHSPVTSFLPDVLHPLPNPWCLPSRCCHMQSKWHVVVCRSTSSEKPKHDLWAITEPQSVKWRAGRRCWLVLRLHRHVWGPSVSYPVGTGGHLRSWFKSIEARS